MTESTQNVQLVCEMLRRYARKIHMENSPSDPHFLDINFTCGKVERSVESTSPTTIAWCELDCCFGFKRRSEEEGAMQAAEAKRDVRYWALAIFVTLGIFMAVMIRTVFHL